MEEQCFTDDLQLPHFDFLEDCDNLIYTHDGLGDYFEDVESLMSDVAAEVRDEVQCSNPSAPTTVDPTVTNPLSGIHNLDIPAANLPERPQAKAKAGRWTTITANVLLSDVSSAVNLPERPGAEEAGGWGNYGRRHNLPVRRWTKDEHMLFLMGLEEYGNGNWKEIATEFVVTKTSTQVASHAQKYFKYHQNPNLKQRNGKSCSSKSSIFDITAVDPHSRARLLRRRRASAAIQQPLPPIQQFTITNYYPPPHQQN